MNKMLEQPNFKLYELICIQGALESAIEKEESFLLFTQERFPNMVKVVKDHLDTLRNSLKEIERVMPKAG